MAESKGNGKSRPTDATLRRVVEQHRLDGDNYRDPSFEQLPGLIKLLESIDYVIDDSKEGIDLTQEEHDALNTEIGNWRHSLTTGMRAMAELIAAIPADEEIHSAAVVNFTRILSDLAWLQHYMQGQQGLLAGSKPLLASSEGMTA